MNAVEPEIDDLVAKAIRFDLEFVDLSEKQVDASVFNILPISDAMRLSVAPFRENSGNIKIATSKPGDINLENQLCSLAGGAIELAVAADADIQHYLKKADGSGQVLDQVAVDFKPVLLSENSQGTSETVDLEAVLGETGIVRLLNSILMAALEKSVSDIHFELSENQLDLKYRIDGILTPATDKIDAKYQEELVSRIKVLAELDVAEQRIPQDGRFRMRFDQRDIDFRVSVLPTQYGEDVVIRILDKASLSKNGTSMSLNGLGFGSEDLGYLRREVRKPYGLMLITGPTGSGKTTTLYGALGEINDGAQKIITIEDPIEYQIPNITQIPVNEKKGLTFARGLRSILRHDPDKIMIGEIRDKETAEIAIQAALTGHLVLASVHANNTLDVIGRFTHWGIDLHDFVASLNSVFAQRLFRRICTSCKGKGCLSCSSTGYDGRLAALEYLRIDEELSELIINRSVFSKMADLRAQKGLRDMGQAAQALVDAELTDTAEIERVLGDQNVE